MALTRDESGWGQLVLFFFGILSGPDLFGMIFSSLKTHIKNYIWSRVEVVSLTLSFSQSIINN